MTKKEDESVEEQIMEEFEDLINEAFKNNKEIQEEKEPEKKPEDKLEIETIENYLLTLGYRAAPRKIHKDYPDLFSVDCDDDMLSETPGVEITPENLLLSSLLTYKKEQELKKIRRKLTESKKKNETRDKKVRDA